MKTCFYVAAACSALLAVGSVVLGQMVWLVPDLCMTAFWLNEADKR